MFNSSCYLGLRTDFILTFNMAEKICRKEKYDSHLPSVHSLAEISFLVEFGRREGWFGYKRGVYLGGRLVDGNIIWTDGSSTDFTFWKDGLPPFSFRSCLAIFSSLYWEDTSCLVDSEGGVLIEDFTICKVKTYQSGLALMKKKFALFSNNQEKTRCSTFPFPKRCLKWLGLQVLSCPSPLLFSSLEL